MQRLRKQQWLEQSIYAILWIAVFLFPLIGAYFAVSGGGEKEEVREMVRNSWLGILPFLGLFLVNNYGLVPYFLFRKKHLEYVISLVCTVFAICCFVPAPMGLSFEKGNRRSKECMLTKEQLRNRIIEHRERAREMDNTHWNSGHDIKEKNPQMAPQSRMRKERRPEALMRHAPFPPFFIRYLIHIVTAFLVVGFNIAIKLFFKSVRDDEHLKELENQRLQSELKYLKYQINPHFFMNTLNNIHALVDIDTQKAKGSIVELSKLMRYVLYEASNKTILLSREIQFLKNYITLMRLRFTDKVFIKVEFPTEIPEVQIPPLLFISFIENAFKHGVSYRRESFIHVSVQLEEGNRISFRCANSCGGVVDKKDHGIGLENIRKRLRLLFGNDYTLSITEKEGEFAVLLLIPLL